MVVWLFKMPNGPIYAEESDARIVVKLIGIIGGCLAALVPVLWFVSMASIGNLFSDEEPSNTILQTVSSPDGRVDAILFTQTPYEGDPTTEVSLVRHDDALPNEAGNVFICSNGSAPLTSSDGGPVVSLRWAGPHDLAITYDPRSSADQAEGRVDVRLGFLHRESISVSYKRTELTPAFKNRFAGVWKGRCSWEGRMSPISFGIAQFGDVFDWKVKGRPWSPASEGTLDDSGQDASKQGHLTLAHDRITGIIFDGQGMSYKIDVQRSGPTVWVAPSHA